MMPLISPLFTPLAASVGGTMIGMASSLHLAMNGRVTGISGTYNGILKRQKDIDWRMTFLSGVGSAGLALHLYSPEVFGNAVPVNAASTVAAGALVGFGTVMGSGCTSGHGVCGLPRASPRSIVAVATFMSTAIITRSSIVSNDVLCKAVQTGPQMSEVMSSLEFLSVSPGMFYGSLLASSLAYSLNNVRLGRSVDTYKSLAASYASGGLFGLGLGVSGMSDPSKVLGFLDLINVWDPSLAFVMGGAVAFNVPVWYALLKKDKPYLLDSFSVPTRRDITGRLVMGSSLFGVGWGLAGLCPGPALLGFATGDVGFTGYVLSMTVGMALFNALSKRGWMIKDKPLF
ncbi:hypothetical protein SARC_04720 [Sphaeroforma arctica JP610]|uniref:Sulphur transport domain-containing protein n=1 Tax=Sphaeroforma arctica JP610 TaxID=667725 RepID=A0A0L0G1H9_9EUKA|nr:hypothetical protein SARC_04720 [Sphaeroforma arctica JP610]KNC82997.1 hypothetical protein SARC_04720 [Sphaeroforma arctica JP610]|eukprot:XP_014156899.1 hypothetical protein SARC_04720 [Sphaeroforma arctica JP610]